MSLHLPELQTIDLDGPVRYRGWDGPAETTFVMVHGLGGSHLSWVQASPRLAGLGRVVALDLPGFGRSPRAGRGSGLMDQRRLLSRFIEEVRGTGKLVICGNSLGGGIGILQAAVEPGTVDGLVLTDSVFPWAAGGVPHPLVMAGFTIYSVAGVGERFVEARMRGMDPERLVRMSFGLVAADVGSIPEEVILEHVELVRERREDPEAPAAFLDAARSLLRLGRRPKVARRALDAVKCPVLVLHGRRDRFVPVAFAEAMLARYPTWRGRIFPDLGHAPQMEAPGRWLAEVADWHAERMDRP